MKNKSSKLTIGIAVLFELIMIITAILNIMSGELKKLNQFLLVCVCIILPFIITYIANKKKVILPPRFELITLFFIMLTLYFGEIEKFYVKYWWWDLLLHGIFGSYAVIIALYLIQGIIKKEKGVTEKRFVIVKLIFSFCFAITLGTLWEIFEFMGDYFFKTDMVNGGLEDTITDLIAKIIFAFITSIICYYRQLKKEK